MDLPLKMQKKQLSRRSKKLVLGKKEFFLDLKIGEFQDKDIGVALFL
jgi:hypothetical protein